MFLPSFCASLLCESFGEVERRACATFRMRVGHSWKERFPLSSAVCVGFFKPQTFQCCVMCPCWRGAASLASQVIERMVPQALLGNPMLHSSSYAWRNPVRFSEQGGEVCQETKLRVTIIKNKSYIEAMWESFGQTALFATISLQKNVSMRFAMEHKYRDVQFILNALAGSRVVVTAEGHLLLEDDNVESLNVGNWGEAQSWQRSICKSVHFLRYVFFLCLGGSSMWDPSGKCEGRWIVNRREGGSNTSKGINAKCLDCEFNVQSWYHFRTTAGDDRTARLVQECVVETHQEPEGFRCGTSLQAGQSVRPSSESTRTRHKRGTTSRNTFARHSDKQERIVFSIKLQAELWNGHCQQRSNRIEKSEFCCSITSRLTNQTPIATGRLETRYCVR